MLHVAEKGVCEINVKGINVKLMLKVCEITFLNVWHH